MRSVVGFHQWVNAVLPHLPAYSQMREVEHEKIGAHYRCQSTVKNQVGNDRGRFGVTGVPVFHVGDFHNARCSAASAVPLRMPQGSPGSLWWTDPYP